MDVPPPEHRRVMVSTGSLPSPHLTQLAASYPFLDVLFPSSDELTTTLSCLESRYSTGKWGLSELFADVDSSHDGSTLMALSMEPSEDTWCIDQRGLLTLNVSKQTYERLGIMGTKLPFKGCSDQYVIRISLRDTSESVANRARVKAALKAWDALREDEGLGKWKVLYHLDSDAPEHFKPKEHEVFPVKCRVRKSSSVHIPVPIAASRPNPEDSDGLDDWHDNVNDIFEWVGMACLGAQRLNVNDQVDPYVAVYEPPVPSQIGSITHLQWRGFLPPGFIQSIIDIAASRESLSSSFIAITAHAFPMSPVTYIPSCAMTPGMDKPNRNESPLRAPRPNAECTWSLILLPEEKIVAGGQLTETTNGRRWIKAESVGQWDMRWG